MQAVSRFRPYIIGLALTLALALLVFAPAIYGYAQTPASTEELELGASLYAENCAVCHGAFGEGRIGATLNQNWPSIRPDLTIRNVIARGVPGSPMPAWSQENGGPLGEGEIDALVAYILSWETGERLIPAVAITPRPEISPVPQVEGDPNRGGLLYDQNCAVCHGADLQGRIGATLNQNWPSIRPDLTIRSVIARGVPGSPMPAWSQENGGPLGEGEINDLTAFILSQAGTSEQPGQLQDPTPPALAPAGEGWLTGWGGLLLSLFGFILLVGIALWLQTRR